MRPGDRKWWILSLLFLATALNYLDRQTLAILNATLRAEFGLNEVDYANLISAFLAAYTVMYTVSGLLIDRWGARWGVAACVTWWSAATLFTGTARSVGALIGGRFLLGIGEPGIFPGGAKVCGEWFMPRLRAVAVGVFSSGASIGAILAPPLTAWLVQHGGWRTAFFIPGIVGLVWVPLWLFTYPSRVRPEPAADTGAVSMPARPWRTRLRDRRLWGVVLPRLASDPVWYFYLFWLPDYLQTVRHFSLRDLGLFAWIPFVFADIGNVAGGWMSDLLVRRGWSVLSARVAVLAAVACVAPLGAWVGYAESSAAALAVICLITFLCQAWSTNITTLAVELAGSAEKASWVGLMGTAGSLGGLAFAQVLGFVIAPFGYSAAFALAALLHPLAALVLLSSLWPLLRDSRSAARSAP